MTKGPGFNASIQASAIHTGDERLIKVIVRVSGPGPEFTADVSRSSLEGASDGSELVLDIRISREQTSTSEDVVEFDVVRIFEISQWVKSVRLEGDVAARAEVVEMA